MLVFWTAKLGRQSVRFYSAAAAPVTEYLVGRRRVVKTLDPSKFREKGQEPISLQTNRRATPPLLGISSGDPSQRTTSRVLLHYLSQRKACFPAEASGYLYFRPPEPHRPAVSGEIRFRLATAPETFATGKDLETPDGELWRQPIFTLIDTKLKPLYDKLVEDGLIPQDVHQSLMNFCSSTKFHKFVNAYYHCGSPILHNLSDPFTLDLSTSHSTFLALTDTGFTQAAWPHPFGDTRTGNCPRVYKGTIRLRFEPSSLPQHAGTRTVVIRVLSEVHPVESVDPDYDGWVRKPQVGELVMTHGIHGPAPLSFNMDASDLLPAQKARLTDVLRLLWQDDPLLAHAPVSDSVTAESLVPQSDPKIIQGRTRIIKTLDPAKIKATGQTSIDISGTPTVHFSGPTVDQYGRIPYYNGRTDRLFPPNTAGHLYFQPAEANRPRISGELRFRISSTTDDFATGEDLKRPDGTVWRAPLFAFIGHSCYRPLLEKIVEEGLVPLELADTLLPDAGRPAFPSRFAQSVLCKLSDSFIYDLSRCKLLFWAVTDEGSASGLWRPGVLIESGNNYFPTYHGVLRARFELSKLPEHAGTRTVVVRVLDILTRITRDPLYDGPIPAPQKGELLVGKLGRKTGFLSYNLDSKATQIVAILRHLWNSDVKLGTIPSPHPPSQRDS